MTGELREYLRGLPVLTGTAPEFDPAQAPDDPVELFAHWLRHAALSGALEPHAMTLSTVDSCFRPSARVLILKDVDQTGWHFAVSAASRKGRELTRNPVAALTFYWPELGRQVRVSGSVVTDPLEVAAADFLARSPGSREVALTGRQSEPYGDPIELDEALDKARRELAQAPTLVPDEWTSYAVNADSAEFWQADPNRRHVRLCYERNGDAWTRTLLWP